MAEKENTVGADEAVETEEKPSYLAETETVGPCKIEVRITVPAETIENEIDSRFREIIQTVPFPGFRLGHTPRKLVEKKVGDDVLSDVKEHIVTESFKYAVEEHDLDPIADPDVDLEGLEIEPGKPIEYKAIMLVRPTVEVPDYDKVTVEKVKPEVTDEMVKAHIDEERRKRSVLEPVADGKVEHGDVAIVDYVATVEGGKLQEEENAEYHHPMPFLGQFQLEKIPGDMLGKGAGDELTITEQLPETWPEPEQAGKELIVAITVQEVKRYVMPELDEEFVKSLDYDSLEEFEEEVRDHVGRHAEGEAEVATNRKMIDALLEASPFDLPEDVVREEVNRRIQRLTAQLRMQGVGEDEMEQKLAEASAAEESEVKRDFQGGFLIDAIAKKEKIFVTESEVEERVAAMAAAYHRSAEEMEEYLEQHDLMTGIRSQMREEKVMEILRKKVKIEE